MPKRKVLIIDDDADFVRIITARFSKSGYAVHSAADGESGLDMARRTRPDVVILDVMLPKLNGFEVCERLKADDALKHIPVIMLTAAYVEDADVARGLRVGAQEYVLKADLVLSKPMPLTDLLARVDSLLEGAEAEDEEKPPAVLVIDDDPVTLRLFEHVLARQGMQVTTRSSAAGALEELDVAAFDLILLDFMMPEMDGIEALREIRKVTDQAAVVMVTGHGSESVATEAIRHEADDYVLKPPKTAEIPRMAARNLAKARLRQERAQLAAQLRETTLQLARNWEKAEERNWELHDALEKLKHTQEELVKAQRLAAVTQTAITVNHEINNPLAAIVGQVQFLLSDEDVTSGPALARLQVIKEQCIRIQQTTHKLARVTQTVTTEYTEGVQMLDLDASLPGPAAQPAGQAPPPDGSADGAEPPDCNDP